MNMKKELATVRMKNTLLQLLAVTAVSIINHQPRKNYKNE